MSSNSSTEESSDLFSPGSEGLSDSDVLAYDSEPEDLGIAEKFYRKKRQAISNVVIS